MREIVNALLYQDRTGCQWDLFPHNLPSRGALLHYFNDLPRRQVRERARRKEDPSLMVRPRHPERARGGRGARTADRV